MIEDDIDKLDDLGPDHGLAGLEADIWAGVTVRLENRRISRQAVTFQLAAMAIALLLVTVTASRIGQSIVEHRSADGLFASELELAPSTLLLGRHT